MKWLRRKPGAWKGKMSFGLAEGLSVAGDGGVFAGYEDSAGKVAAGLLVTSTQLTV